MNIISFKFLVVFGKRAIILFFLTVVMESLVYGIPGEASICTPIELSNTFSSVNLKDHFKVYASQEDIAIEKLPDIFLKTISKSYKPNFDDYIWVSFALKNHSLNENFIFEINNNYIRNYFFYQCYYDSLLLLAEGGASFNYHERSINNRRFLEKVTIPIDSTVFYILKIDNRERETSLSLRFWDKNVFFKSESRNELFYNLYFGGLVFISLFSVLLGVILKMRVFFAYSFYALIMAYFMFDNLGFAYGYLYSESPEIKRFSDIFFVLPLLFSFTNFAAVYFNTRKTNPKVFVFIKYFYLALILFAFYWVLSSAGNTIHYYILTNYVLIFFTFVILGTIVVKGFQKDRVRAWFFLLAVFVLFIGGVIFAFTDAGHLPKEWFPTNPLLMGSVVEFGIFSTALIYEVHIINKTKNNLLIVNAEHQKKLLNAFVEGTEKERTRLSGELHDNIGSRLALLKHKLMEKDRDEAGLQEDLDKLYDNVRSMSHELSPGEFQIISLQEYLEIYLQDFQETTAVRVKAFFNKIPKKLCPNIASQIFRVIQEAAQNVQKHAQAKTMEIQLIGHETEIVLTIDDDGKGFNPVDIDIVNASGISNMRTRVQSLGGKFEISAQSGRGTHILISIPYLPEQ